MNPEEVLKEIIVWSDKYLDGAITEEEYAHIVVEILAKHALLHK